MTTQTLENVKGQILQNLNENESVKAGVEKLRFGVNSLLIHNELPICSNSDDRSFYRMSFLGSSYIHYSMSQLLFDRYPNFRRDQLIGLTSLVIEDFNLIILCELFKLEVDELSYRQKKLFVKTLVGELTSKIQQTPNSTHKELLNILYTVLLYLGEQRYQIFQNNPTVPGLPNSLNIRDKKWSHNHYPHKSRVRERLVRRRSKRQRERSLSPFRGKKVLEEYPLLPKEDEFDTSVGKKCLLIHKKGNEDERGRVYRVYPYHSKLFIGNIDYPTITKEYIRQLFSKYGELLERVEYRGKYAFCQFENEEIATRAMNAEDGKLHGRLRLRIDFALEKKFGQYHKKLGLITSPKNMK